MSSPYLSEEDDDDFAVYTNVAKNMKDTKKAYMHDMAKAAEAASASYNKELVKKPLAISEPEDLPEVMLSLPKQQKIVIDLPVVLSDDEECISSVPSSSASSNHSTRARGQACRALTRNCRKRRGQSAIENETANALSMKLLSKPIAEKYKPRKSYNFSFEDTPLEDSYVEEEDNYELSVKVRWKSAKIYKFAIRKYQKLSSIFEHFSTMENIPQSKILLTLEDNIISVEDTPDSLHLTIANIIEGGMMTTTDNTVVKAATAPLDGNTIEVKIRTKDSKSLTMITMQKSQKMLVLMTKYSELMEIAVDCLKFSFDGETVDPNDTAEDLDLEGGEMFDLIIK